MDEQGCIDSALARSWYAESLPASLGAGYEAATRSPRRQGLRIQLATILPLTLLCSLFDVWAGVWREGLWIRLGVLVPLLLAALWILRRDRSIAVEGGVVIASVVAIVGGVTILGLEAQSPYTEGYLIAAGLIGFTVNLSMPLRIRQAKLLFLGNVSAYCSLALLGGWPSHFAETPQTVLFFSLVMLATLPHALRREQGSMDVYLLQLRDGLRVRELARLVDELTRVADRDALTEIGNRRCFDKTLDLAWGDALLEGGCLALAMIDVDHFKRFNDAAGHAEGDRCLRAVARAVAAHVRPGDDVPARYGGEEFAVVMALRGTGEPRADDLRRLAERVRAAVEALGIPHPGGVAGGIVTVSVGVASAVPGRDGQDPMGLLVAADRALYRAKSAGRNRVELAVGGVLELAA